MSRVAFGALTGRDVVLRCLGICSFALENYPGFVCIAVRRLHFVRVSSDYLYTRQYNPTLS